MPSNLGPVRRESLDQIRGNLRLHRLRLHRPITHRQVQGSFGRPPKTPGTDRTMEHRHQERCLTLRTWISSRSSPWIRDVAFRGTVAQHCRWGTRETARHTAIPSGRVRMGVAAAEREVIKFRSPAPSVSGALSDLACPSVRLSVCRSHSVWRHMRIPRCIVQLRHYHFALCAHAGETTEHSSDIQRCCGSTTHRLTALADGSEPGERRLQLLCAAYPHPATLAPAPTPHLSDVAPCRGMSPTNRCGSKCHASSKT